MQTKQSQSHLQMRALTEGAVMVALATALGYLKLFELPQGGAVCIGMRRCFSTASAGDWARDWSVASPTVSYS